MKNIVLEDFLDFETHFVEFVKRTAYFSAISGPRFCIFNDSGTEVTYTYGDNEFNEISVDEIKAYLKDSKVIQKDSFAELRELTGMTDVAKSTCYMLNVFHPSMENHIMLGSLIFYSLKPALNFNEYHEFNIHYFQQLVYHIQTVISNYERIYFLVDTFTELMVARDRYMPYHMTNVANLCVKLSAHLNLLPKDQMILYFSALLHDTGKLFVSENIINKPGRLTEDEFNLVKLHSRKGAELVTNSLHGMSLLQSIPKIIRHHHEWYNGQGYPDGLVGTAIPYLSRILTVADAVDAMSSKRAYKDIETHERIVNELKNKSGEQFDPMIANAMIDMLVHETRLASEDRNNSNLFVPKGAFSFKYSIGNVTKSLSGNLLLKNRQGQFIVHDSDSTVYSVKAMQKATISYFEQNDLIEYRVNVKHYENGTYHLDNIIYLPTDKTFSMVWSSKAQVFNKDTMELFEAQVIKLGGDSIVFQLNAIEGQKYIDNSKVVHQIKIDEAIESVSLQMVLTIKVVNFYKTDYGFAFICRYQDIQPGQKDRMLRLLFRKQSMLKRSKMSQV
jgi:HD-GYP domain-containing protein (c-di-GMP phosphodiesterase class II)